MSLNKDKLVQRLGAKKSVFITALDDDVFLRELSAKEVMDLTERQDKGELSLSGYTFSLIMASVIDENGEQFLTLDLAEKLGVAALSELTEKIVEFNGMKLQFEKAKADLKKVRAAAS